MSDETAREIHELVNSLNRKIGEAMNAGGLVVQLDILERRQTSIHDPVPVISAAVYKKIL